LSQIKTAEIDVSLKIITKAQTKQYAHQSHSSLRALTELNNFTVT